MDKLNIRQKELIRLLLAEVDFKPIKYFSKILKASDKTLSKDLSFIEARIINKDIDIVRKPGIGIHMKINNNQKIDLLNHINSNSEKFDPLSIENRRTEIIKLLLTESNQYTSIQKLADIYFVSKASIVNDLKLIEDWLFNYNITLNKSIEGTKINGSEVNIRKAIASITSELPREKRDCGDLNYLSRLDSQTINGLSNIFDTDLIHYIEKILNDLEQTLQCTISEPYYTNLLTHILICIKRVSEGNQIQEQDHGILKLKSPDNIIYRSAADLASKIYRRYKININDSEIYYIYQYLISSGFKQALLESTSMIEYGHKIDCINFTNSLIKNVSDILNLDLTNDSLLREGLRLHIQPMLNRLKYNIQIKNPLLQEIQEGFSEIINVIQLALYLMSKKYNLNNISTDEIGYIATYFQAAIERGISHKRVIVVCHSGFGTSQLLTTRLKRAFPQWEVVDIISVHKLSKTDLNEIDFIISTVHLDIKEKPYLLVSALLSGNDIRNIKNILVEKSFDNKKDKILSDIIGQELSETDIYINVENEKLTNELENINGQKLVFHEVNICGELKLKLAKNSKIQRVAIQILNNDEEANNSINFYLLINDFETLKNVLIEIYNLYKLKNGMNYILECNRVIDVKRFFTKK